MIIRSNVSLSKIEGRYLDLVRVIEGEESTSLKQIKEYDFPKLISLLMEYAKI